MATSTETEPLWLRSTQITGLDQLGVQVISISIYSELLPGITNVTDRVRYYSFFPWVLYRYAKEVGSSNRKTWQEHVRRAEFLLALVGRAHHMEHEEGGEAIVGALQANRAIEELIGSPSKNFALSTWTAVSEAGKEGSYFKNREGGFGQYYKGQIADLGLINLQEEGPGVSLVRDRGTGLAEICDKQAGRKQFWNAVIKDQASFKLIQELGDHLCPCCLVKFPQERDFLLDAVFHPLGQEDVTTAQRAQTLRLLLSFLSRAQKKEPPWSAFRPAAYFGHDEAGTVTAPPAKLTETMVRWRIYQAGEYVHLALEEAFLATLLRLKGGPQPVDRFAGDFANEALNTNSNDLGLGPSKDLWRDRTIGDLLTEAATRQGAPSKWTTTPWSEESLINSAAAEVVSGRRLALSFACILSVLARNAVPADPFQKFVNLGPEFLGRYPVHFPSISQFIRTREKARAADVCAALLREKVLLQHLRVAMRKLRYQVQATFKFIVEEGHFVWVEDFEPTYTSPRLRQAFLFLRDLGLTAGKGGNWGLTKLGATILEQAHDS